MVSKKERRERAIAALEQVGLGEQIHKRPNQMSGGQMQRVAIARALINNPDILLADEPTGALDSETSVQIMELLKEISKDKLIIMVTHNPDLAYEYSNRIIRCMDGVVTDDSNPFIPEQQDFEEEKQKAEEERKKGKKPSMSFATAFGLAPPLIPIQLLWVNLVTDSLPAMALGTEKTEKDIMKRPPISPGKGFFSDGLWIDISLEGMLVGTLTVLAYLMGSLMFRTEDAISLGRTMAFCTLSFCEIIHAVNTRSSLPLYKAGIFSNRMMNLAVAVCVILQAAVVIIAPLAEVFGTVALNTVQWGIVVALSLVPLITGEIGKMIFSRSERGFKN